MMSGGSDWGDELGVALPYTCGEWRLVEVRLFLISGLDSRPRGNDAGSMLKLCSFSGGMTRDCVL